MNYFTREELGQFSVISDDYEKTVNDEPSIMCPYFNTQQMRVHKEDYIRFQYGKIPYITFQFSVLNEDGNVTVHWGECGRDDRVLI